MSILFSPIELGGLTLSNRTVVSPMCQYSAVDGVAQPWHHIHIGGLMLSGAGLVIMEATGVSPEGRSTHGCLGLYTDEQELAFARLIADLRRYSPARIGLQLQHAGRKASARSIADRWKGEALPPEEGAWQTVAPSPIAFDESWPAPKEMDEAEIARVVEAFAASAERASRAGFDLIEIHGAHGYLLHSFLSPLTNKRSDRYGGSLENRMRFPLEIAEAVRRVWPRDRALGFRMNSTDWHPDGLTLDDAVVLANGLKAAGFDYVVMSAGNIAPGITIPRAAPGHQVEFATRIKRETGMTAMAVGMIGRAEQAEQIVASGEADMVAIGRGFLDDPRWAIHAAAALGVDVDYPEQYIRVRPNNWLGYRFMHPDTPQFEATKQLDRPKSVSWDRPPTSGQQG